MVVLPKCPFCVFAYSSTIMLCGKDSVTSKTSFHYSEMTVLFTAILCSITLLSIALNRRGKRTYYAMGIALAGSAMALLSVVYGGGQYLYYVGVSVIFTGVWLNGSLLYVISRIRNKMSSHTYKVTLQKTR